MQFIYRISEHRRQLCIAWAAALCVATGSITHAATLPQGFTESLVASGLANPTAMSFAPDGRLFVCEQGGQLRVIRDGVLLPTPFVSIAVDAVGERGLLGVAFDPDFATNQYVYVYYTATTPATHNRISRFTANGDVAVPGSEVVLLDLNNVSDTNHNGGAIHFGLDGKLYAAVGDDGAGSNAQTLANLKGKMLRINADGTIPPDNPFYNTATGRNRAIWALGLRNPFTFSVQPGTGAIFINDVGQQTWEEINDGLAGANYGWPATEGHTPDPRFRSPRYAYGHAEGCAITGGAFYDPGVVQYPADYIGDYFFADYCSGWIRKLDSIGNTVDDFANGIAAPVDLKVSADGDLYYLARGWGSSSGVVYRIQFGATAPSITGHPADVTVRPGEPATFSVGASGTPTLAYQWQRDGANIPGATAATYTLPSPTLSDHGATFRAVVSNDYGSATSNEALLTVSSNQHPTAAILQPSIGTLYSGGEVIAFAGSGADQEDGELPAAAFTWQVDFHHDTHTHPFMQPTAGMTGGSITIPTGGETSANVWYRIYLTVRDSEGATHTTHRDLLPRKSRVSLTTDPPGLEVKLDGTPVTTPISFDGVVGIIRNIEAVSPQTVDGVRWTFESWSDGGAAGHDIVTPPSDTTYTATLVATPVADGRIVDAHFDTGTGAFIYVDDAFRGTAQPGYASGMRSATEGFSGGALKVTLGGIDDVVITGTSGGWRRSFGMASAAPVTLSFRYMLTQAPNYEPDELSEVVVRVDALQPGVGGTDYVARIAGDGNGGEIHTTGWQLFEANLGTLAAGTHTLTIGGYNNQKTFNDEITSVLIDDLVVTSSAAPPPPVLTSIAVTPASATVSLDGTQTFTAQGYDQYGNPIAAAVAWTVNGGGTIDSAGIFTATAAGGPFTVCAQDGAVSGTATVTVVTTTAILFEAHFDTAEDDFAYLDDAFRETAQPDYAAGERSATEGFSGGALKVTLGGIDDVVITGTSGGWQRTFSLATAAPVTLAFRYMLTQAPNYESDELSEVIVRVDALQPGLGGADYVARIAGDGNGGEIQTTGWQLFEVNLGTLAAGTHTLTIGGYNSQKTFNDEITEALIDDVVVTVVK